MFTLLRLLSEIGNGLMTSWTSASCCRCDFRPTKIAEYRKRTTCRHSTPSPKRSVLLTLTTLLPSLTSPKFLKYRFTNTLKNAVVLSELSSTLLVTFPEKMYSEMFTIFCKLLSFFMISWSYLQYGRCLFLVLLCAKSTPGDKVQSTKKKISPEKRRRKDRAMLVWRACGTDLFSNTHGWRRDMTGSSATHALSTHGTAPFFDYVNTSTS